MKQRLLTTLTISRHKYHQHLPIRLRPRLGAAEMAPRACNLFYAPAVASWSKKQERDGRRKVQAREALDEELGTVEDVKEKRAGL
jgi:hypothetical protein